MGKKLIHVTEEKLSQLDSQSQVDADVVVMRSPEEVIDILKQEGSVISEWHVYADARVYGFYCSSPSVEVIGRSVWKTFRPQFDSNSKVFLHTTYAEKWLAPHLASTWGVPVHAVLKDQWFHPIEGELDPTYDKCAELYDAAFEDIRVRKIEWEYVTGILTKWKKQNGRSPKVVEIGCGNGQMLAKLLANGSIASAIGFDRSAEMVQCAKKRNVKNGLLDFKRIPCSEIPCSDNSVDVAISFMSFRYLDWQNICDSIDRVIKTNGIFIMVDMAETILSDDEVDLYKKTKKRDEDLDQQYPNFKPALNSLVKNENWKAMLDLNPKEQAQAYEVFLSTRYPSGKWQRLYVCYDHSLFGFVSQEL